MFYITRGVKIAIFFIEYLCTLCTTHTVGCILLAQFVWQINLIRSKYRLGDFASKRSNSSIESFRYSGFASISRILFLGPRIGGELIFRHGGPRTGIYIEASSFNLSNAERLFATLKSTHSDIIQRTDSTSVASVNSYSFYLYLLY